MFGIGSVVWPAAPTVRPRSAASVLLSTTASWALGIAVAFSATVLVPLVKYTATR